MVRRYDESDGSDLRERRITRLGTYYILPLEMKNAMYYKYKLVFSLKLDKRFVSLIN